MLLRKYFRGVKIKYKKFEILNILDKTVFYSFHAFISIFKLKKEMNFFIDKKNIKNIIIIRTGGIGDALLAVPFFRKLKQEFPKSEISIITSKRNNVIIKYLSRELKFHKVFLIEKDLLKVFKNKYDVVFNLDQSKYNHITPVTTSLIRSKYKIGYDIRLRAQLYTHKVVYKHEDYESECMLKQLRFFNIPVDFNSDDLLLKKELFSDSLLKFNLKKNFIALGLGGLNPQNRLPKKTIRQVLLWLGKTNKQIVFFGSGQEREYIEELKKGIHGNFVNLCGKTSFQESFNLFSKADVFFGYDGGTLHMAVVSGCRTVSIWGPSLFQKWAPRGKNHTYIKEDLPCQPCVYGRFPVFKKCPYEMFCLTDIHSKDIIKELGALL